MKWTKKRKKKLQNILLYIGVVTLGLFSFNQLAKMNGNQFSSLSSSYKTEFIQSMVPKAKEIQTNYGVLPSINIGQAILESDWGTSDLSEHSNNYYGIKQGSVSEVYSTKEYIGNEEITVDASFAVYGSMEDSMEAYAKLLTNGTTWNNNLYASVINADNYIDAAHALQNSGYATDPQYANKLISVIEDNQLSRYDK